MKKGQHFSSAQIDKIATLLRETDMTPEEIAERMDCSKSAINSFNRQARIRDYANHRNNWSVTEKTKKAS